MTQQTATSIKYIGIATPRNLALGANDRAHCAAWLPECKASITWDNGARLYYYRLSSGERVMVCCREHALLLDRS